MNMILKILLLFFIPTSMLISDSQRDPVVAEVNGKKIMQSDVDAFVAKSLPGARYSLMSPSQKQEVIDRLVDRALYLSVAKQEGIEQDPIYQKGLIRAKENLMLDVWMKKSLESIPVSEKEIRAYYRKHDDQFYQEEAASARHILVSTEAEAREIIEDLKRSHNLEQRFIELAHARSTGPSRKNGGDLGWFNKDQMVPEFSNAALALNVGEITTTPVKTHFGYHVIYLTDKRAAGKLPYSTVRERILSALRLKKFQQRMKSLRENLRQSADIKIKQQ